MSESTQVCCPVCKGTGQMTLRFRFINQTLPPTTRLIECAYCLGLCHIEVDKPKEIVISVNDLAVQVTAPSEGVGND